MGKDVLEYKGYHTKVKFYADELVLRGKIEGITDFVDFECSDLRDVEAEFHHAVDDYLEFCAEVGKSPEKEYKGTFNIRIKPDLHKRLFIESLKNDESLNATVERAIEAYFENSDGKKIITISADTFRTETASLINPSKYRMPLANAWNNGYSFKEVVNQ